MKRGLLVALSFAAVNLGSLTGRAADPKLPPEGDLVQMAARVGTLSRFLAALRAADQVALLRGTERFTVFAPEDDAFENLPAGTLETLLKPENKGQLMALLSAHLVPGKVVRTGEMPRSGELVTATGSSIVVARGENNTVTVGDAQIVRADVAAENGVLHVINKVLLPPAR